MVFAVPKFPFVRDSTAFCKAIGDNLGLVVHAVNTFKRQNVLVRCYCARYFRSNVRLNSFKTKRLVHPYQQQQQQQPQQQHADGGAVGLRSKSHAASVLSVGMCVKSVQRHSHTHRST